MKGRIQKIHPMDDYARELAFGSSWDITKRAGHEGYLSAGTLYFSFQGMSPEMEDSIVSLLENWSSDAEFHESASHDAGTINVLNSERLLEYYQKGEAMNEGGIAIIVDVMGVSISSFKELEESFRFLYGDGVYDGFSLWLNESVIGLGYTREFDC